MGSNIRVQSALTTSLSESRRVQLQRFAPGVMSAGAALQDHSERSIVSCGVEGVEGWGQVDIHVPEVNVRGAVHEWATSSGVASVDQGSQPAPEHLTKSSHHQCTPLAPACRLALPDRFSTRCVCSLHAPIYVQPHRVRHRGFATAAVAKRPGHMSSRYLPATTLQTCRFSGIVRCADHLLSASGEGECWATSCHWLKPSWSS
jgi:hypothetical protein